MDLVKLIFADTCSFLCVFSISFHPPGALPLLSRKDLKSVVGTLLCLAWGAVKLTPTVCQAQSQALLFFFDHPSVMRIALFLFCTEGKWGGLF